MVGLSVHKFRAGSGDGSKASIMMAVCMIFSQAFFASEAIGTSASFDCNGEHDTYHPHPTDCTKFYQCFHGNAARFDCPANLEFNIYTVECDYPKNVDCEDGVRPSTTTTTTPTTATTTPTVSFDCNGEHGTYHPHPTDCTKFYQCFHGNAALFDCPANLHFNIHTVRCDYQENVECEDGVRPSTTTTTKATTPAVSFDCNGEHDTYHPHPTDCTKFYQCFHGNAALFDCPANLHFNIHTVRCDYQENVECEDGVRPSTTTTKTTTTPAVSFDCNGEHDTYRTHPTDCTKFYQCFHGNAALFDCPANLHFNIHTVRCDYPKNVDCKNGVRSTTATTTTTTRTGTPFNCNGKHGTYHADPEDCSKFYQCDWGTAVSHSCAPGTLFNPTIDVCDHPDNVVCPSGFDCAGKHGTYHADPENCSRFYQCVWGVAYLHNCAPGTLFSPDINVCDHPRNVVCVK